MSAPAPERERELTGDVLRLPVRRPDGGVELVEHAVHAPVHWPVPERPASSRTVFAAAHVVPQTGAENVPGAPAVLDWEATLAFRHRLWGLGLGVAEAMDTAQRGMGLDPAATAELVRRSATEAAAVGGAIAAGAGTDQLGPGPHTLAQVRAAYEEQIALVEDAGAQVVLMASRQLAAAARDRHDYLELYGHLLRQVRRPAVLHWLGEVFDPALAGYWGSRDVETATDAFVELVHAHAGAVDGVKVSLLDAGHERALRRRLPAGVRLYTGDDFNYPELIEGEVVDGREHHSDALLGIFAAIPHVAAAGLLRLDAGDPAGFRAALDPTLPLARHVFGAPTPYYKAGIAFLNWLDGRQPGYAMVGGLHAARSAVHQAQAFRLADEAGVLTDPQLAARRLRGYLAVHGIDA
ncbi:dihydrodipicolinate synthase family protein [Kineococcus sp. SYSU DK006]|uniref:dihydrodipicolinate synthase family protein n=1 Tax=Kineococcus sp. SYSU DK006 TaxID=3383127 RepID=UPI003D7DCFBB